MFTGLIEARVALRSWETRGSGARMVLERPELAPGLPPWEPALGESLAVSGCCLTVAEIGPEGELAFDLSAETLSLTWFGDPGAAGKPFNLERSVRLADRLGGHLVSGHVDAVGRVAAVEDSGDGGKLISFEVPLAFDRYVVPKGSVAIDGISLTVVEPQGRRFDVAVIPETLERTSLGHATPGQRVHLEADQIGKWVERLLEARSYGV